MDPHAIHLPLLSHAKLEMMVGVAPRLSSYRSQASPEVLRVARCGCPPLMRPLGRISTIIAHRPLSVAAHKCVPVGENANLLTRLDPSCPVRPATDCVSCGIGKSATVQASAELTPRSMTVIHLPTSSFATRDRGTTSVATCVIASDSTSTSAADVPGDPTVEAGNAESVGALRDSMLVMADRPDLLAVVIAIVLSPLSPTHMPLATSLERSAAVCMIADCIDWP